MSCDQNGKHAIRALLASGSPTAQRVLDAFADDPEAATAGLLQIVATARAQASKDHLLAHQDPKRALYWDATQALATRRMVTLFRQWQQDVGPGWREPAHGPVSPHFGVRLPRDQAAHHGWAALQQTLAYFGGTAPALPPVAAQVLTGAARRRITATSQDCYGHLRCRNCGRFVAQQTAHLCPQTATSATLAAALRRKLRTPAGAYDPHSAFTALLAEAHAHETVAMVHPLTGEAIAASLDGLLLALQQGFIPEGWTAPPPGQHTLVTLTDGRVVPVLNEDGLTTYIPGADPVATVAAAYGHGALAALAAPAPSPLIPAHLTVDPVTGRLDGDTAWDGLTSKSSAHVYEHAPILSDDQVLADSPAERYTTARLRGHYFRKHHGVPLTIDGETFLVGARSPDPAHQATARAVGLAGPTHQVTIGNSLVTAVALLRDAQLVRDWHGESVEVTTPEGGLISYAAANVHHMRLIAATPVDHAGSYDGDSRLTPAKLAAVIALLATNPRTALDLALAHDLAAYRAGRGHALAVADAAYLALQATLDHHPTKELVLGTACRIVTERCPACGQFRGMRHHCRVDPAASHIAPPSPFDVRDYGSPDRSWEERDEAAEDHDADELPGSADAGSPEPVPDIAFGSSAGAGMDGDSMPALIRDTLTRLLAEAAGPMQRTPAAGPTASGAERPPPIVRPTPPRTTLQQEILAAVRPPEATLDPYLRHLPAAIGGDRATPLPVQIPPLDPQFAINRSTERALRVISSALQLAWNPKNAAPRTDMRAFALYGPPGTGKNTIARQVAASLGLPYTEVTINPDTAAQEEIGATVLSEGSTRAQLGRIGYAAATGQVIAINEIVRNPKLATAFQSMIEDGVIELQGTEGGAVTVPVHPNTVFVFTWNPGNEGDAERMAMAPLSRTIAVPLEPPSIEEQAERLLADVRRSQGTTTRPQNVAARATYTNHPVEANPTRAMAVARFMDGMQKLAQNGQIALGGTNTVVGPRETKRFYYLLESTQDPELALETLKIYCDQDPALFAEQWRAVTQLYHTIFGYSRTPTGGLR